MTNLITITTKPLIPVSDCSLRKDQIEAPKKCFTARIRRFLKDLKPSPVPIVTGRILSFPVREHLITGVTVYRPDWAKEAVFERQLDDDNLFAEAYERREAA